MGVRCDTPGLDALLRRTLAAYRVADVEAPPNFSLRLPLDTTGSGAANQKLSFLHRAHTNVIRSRRRARALLGLLGYLDEFLPPPQGFLRAQALALVQNGRAILIPRPLEAWIELSSSPLHRFGFQFVDRQGVLVDLARRELVVPEPRLALDWEPVRGILNPEGREREPAPVAPGRYPIAAWAFLQRENEAPAQVSNVLELFQVTDNAFDLGVPETLDVLRTFSSRLRVGRLPLRYDDGFPHALAALACP